MCGISGLLSLKDVISEKEIHQVEKMSALLTHRGPDQTDFIKHSHCVLGNNRLKIIDFSENAHLPLSNLRGDIWIAYNGEVTNFEELKKQFQLEKKYRFRSTGDTEVLVYLYEELGIEFLSHLSGMFAFCLYDQRQSKAYLVRDFFGIRPVFYMVKNNGIYFSSEIKSFLDIDSFQSTIDLEAMYHYFSLAYIPGAHTPYKEIKELEGGHFLEVDLNRKTWGIKEYYPIVYEPDHSLTVEEAAGEVRRLLKDSVRRNLISDAPVGLTLSGGFDTSTILALTKELGASENIHTFSVKMGEKSFDESYYQRIMADYARSIHHEISVSPTDVLTELIRHMAYMDEPNGDGASIPLFILAQKAKRYVRVLLSGEGGDEIFNAYETHGAYVMRRLYRQYTPQSIRKLIKNAMRFLPTSYQKLSIDFLLKRFTEGAELGTPEAHLFWRYVLREQEKQMLMDKDAQWPPTDFLFRQMYDASHFPEGLNKISLIDIKYYFVGDLMVKNDRMVMAHSIEARFPYMDRILFDFVKTMPVSMRIRRGGLIRRYIQKRAVRDIVPRAIMNRSNMGLEMPHSIWFLKELRPLVERYFAKENIEKTGILNYKIIHTIWQRHLKGEQDYGRALWCILMFLIWFDLFIHNRDYKQYLS